MLDAATARTAASAGHGLAQNEIHHPCVRKPRIRDLHHGVDGPGLYYFKRALPSLHVFMDGAAVVAATPMLSEE